VPKASRGDVDPPAPAALAVACEGRVVRRALAFAVVVGSVLVAINHGDALLAGSLTRGQLLKIGLTVLVPYVVSTWSSVLAVRSAA
jgi:hypothetical protein